MGQQTRSLLPARNETFKKPKAKKTRMNLLEEASRIRGHGVTFRQRVPCMLGKETFQAEVCAPRRAGRPNPGHQAPEFTPTNRKNHRGKTNSQLQWSEKPLTRILGLVFCTCCCILKGTHHPHWAAGSTRQAMSQHMAQEEEMRSALFQLRLSWRS